MIIPQQKLKKQARKLGDLRKKLAASQEFGDDSEQQRLLEIILQELNKAKVSVNVSDMGMREQIFMYPLGTKCPFDSGNKDLALLRFIFSTQAAL